MKGLSVLAVMLFSLSSMAGTVLHGKDVAKKMGAIDGRKLGVMLALSPFQSKDERSFHRFLRHNNYPVAYRAAFAHVGARAYEYARKNKAVFHGSFKGVRAGCHDARMGIKAQADVLAQKLDAADFPKKFVRGVKYGYARGFKRCTKRMVKKPVKPLPAKPVITKPGKKPLVTKPKGKDKKEGVKFASQSEMLEILDLEKMFEVLAD